MINSIYRLISPRVISIKYEDLSFTDQVIVKPDHMALCHADQRYYQGNRDQAILRKKLPMALCHECCGRVVYDPSGTYKSGQLVALIPNVSTEDGVNVFENYRKSSRFLSSGHDGFMREYISINHEQIVPVAEGINPEIAAITEFVSVACHSIHRLQLSAHKNRNRIAIFGDGSLSYTVSCVLKQLMPDSDLIIFGKDPNKLGLFTFAKETHFIDTIPEDMHFDHAFECVGRQVSSYAISDIIKYIHPQGNVMLLGVSEEPVPINTRNVLEKGLTLIGCSRSGREDFITAAKVMGDEATQDRLSMIISSFGEVKSIKDIHSAFHMDMNNPFKTVFKWSM